MTSATRASLGTEEVKTAPVCRGRASLALICLILVVPLAVACANRRLYVRPGSQIACTSCDPARSNPDDLEHRVVLVAAAAVSGKTTFVFLGDNIYPRGMPIDGSPGRKNAEWLLDLQLDLVGHHAQGVVVPGNHDWDKSGAQGLARILAQGKYVDQRRASAGGSLQFQPTGGCPGPIYMDLGERDVTDATGGIRPRVRLVFFDSEWLLRDGENRPKQVKECLWGRADAPVLYEGSARKRLTNEVFAEKLKSLVTNDHDVVLLSHHPVRTAGSHGGKYPWWTFGFRYFWYHVGRPAQDLSDLPPRTSPPSKLDSEPFEVHSTG